MRNSPLRHPLAILRITIGLTQKQMAELVHRSARTIQAIELGQLPLSEELALAVAQATGIDAGWLLEKNPATPPRKGLTAAHAGDTAGAYTREDYELHRSIMEAPVASAKEAEAALREAAKNTFKIDGQDHVNIPASVNKRALNIAKKDSQRAQDKQICEALDHLLAKTTATAASDLIRWKIRQFIQNIADENSVAMNLKNAPLGFLSHVHVASKTGKRLARPLKILR
jgi:transcriptional regulator with XRE-family HTH domain